MLLRNISQADPITALVLEGLEQTCPILADADFYGKPGAADTVRKHPSGFQANTVFRDLDESVTTTPGSRSTEPATKRIVSIESKVDTVLEDRGVDPESELATQTRLDSREAGYVLQDKFFHGDNGTNSKEFDGLINVVKAGNVDTAGVQLPVASSQANIGAAQEAIEKLLQFFATIQGGASHAYMPNALKVRLMTIGKQLGYYTQGKDEFGATVDRIGDTIIRGAGYKANGTPILDFNETVGSDSDCGSIVAVRWGEAVDVSVLTSVGVHARYLGQVGKFLTNSADMDAAIVLQNDNALHRSKGWRL